VLRLESTLTSVENQTTKNMESTKKTAIIYWTATGLFAVPNILSGAAFLAGLPEVVKSFTHLGYPAYLLKFLGAAKLLGVTAILVGKFPRLKEWAYAGFAFDMLGAAYSHFAAGDGVKAIPPLLLVALVATSYSCWRRLPFRRRMPPGFNPCVPASPVSP
jgi:uncharacterized membrane protein YphA (DoxX/SURF4 family)